MSSLATSGAPDDWREGTDFLAPGEAVDLDNCAREPIHLVGAAQPGGAILVLEPAGDRRVVQATTNAAQLLGVGDVVGGTLADLVGCTADELAERCRDAPCPLEVAGRAVEARIHRSRSGYDVVELTEVTERAPHGLHRQVLDAISGLQSADDLAALGAHASEMVRSVLGFDRVWIYRFDDEWNGEVVAESRRDDLRPFLGLHFDAGDIPPQARALFLDNRVRLIRDAVGAASPLAPATLPDGSWLDLSDATLRAVSPMHLTYLANLGVTASASLALVVEGRLWGLCSAHHYDGPRLVDHATETAAALLAQVIALQIGVIEARDAARRRAELGERANVVLAAVARNDSVLNGLLAAPDDLLAVTGATGAVVRVAGRVRSVGRVPGGDVVDAVLDELDGWVDDGADVVVTDRLGELLRRPADVLAAGALALRLARDAGNWIVWFRPEFSTTVTWADPMRPAPATSLTPEASFAIFQQTVEGRSRPWDHVEIDAARYLRSSLGALVFQRTEQLARSYDALRTANGELDRFAYVAAHDLKEPLRGIHNYADILSEELGEVSGVGDDAHHALASIHRLTLRMAGLVDGLLSYATVGQSAFDSRAHQLSVIVADTAELVSQRATERDARISVVSDGVVHGDRTQLVQLFTNLIGNALKYCPPDRRPEIEVELISLEQTERGWDGWPQHNVDLPPPTVVAVRDNGIGVAVRDRERIFEVFRRLWRDDEYGGGTGAGLPIARRIAERHGGALWVESNHPSGSVFLVALASPANVAVEESA